jgi:hypothetical protein
MHHVAPGGAGGKYHFDISTLTLELSVPQAFVNELEEGYASRKAGTAGSTPSTRPIMPVSITAIIKAPGITKVALPALPAA